MPEQQEVLAIIPARGGSKGVPGKNIRDINGKPLIAYNIEAAKASRRVTRVAVSTDCPDIERVSKAYGAEVVRRPKEISDDTASSESALNHVLGQLKETEDYAPDAIAFMQCTVPTTRGEHLDKGLTKLFEEDLDCCFAAIPFDKFLWRPGQPEGFAEGINHDHTKQRLRRQDLPEQVLETGAFYLMRTSSYLAHQNRFCGKTKYVILGGVEMLDIDTLQDLKRAEIILSELTLADTAS